MATLETCPRIVDIPEAVDIGLLQKGLWYFAHPYTVRDCRGRALMAAQEANYRLACQRSARLLERDILIFSPIPHAHPIHRASPEFLAREEEDLWYLLDNTLIDTGIFSGIILAPGWETSTGCRLEGKRFLEQKKPVYHYRDVIRAAETGRRRGAT